MAEDFDEILQEVGGFGRYQTWLIAVVLVPTSFFSAFIANLTLFQLNMPAHWCQTPDLHNTSLSLEQRKDLMIPRLEDSDEYSSCEMFQWTSDENGHNYTITNTTQECNAGWTHDTSQYTATLSTSFDWVCDRGHYSTHLLSTIMTGNAVGTFFLAILADKYLGRRLVFFLSLGIHIVFTMPLLITSNFTIHLILRFLAGLAFQAYFLMPYIICLEVIPVKHRALAVMLSFIAWTLGMCFTAVVAWILPHWRYLILFSCIPCFLGFFYWRIMPESPRWLSSRGQVEECSTILAQIGKVNKYRGMSREELLIEIKRLAKIQPADQPLSRAFAFPKLRVLAVLLFVLSYCQFLIYGIILLGINVLPDNSFLSHFILSIFELPSNFLGWFFVQYLGRRFTSVATFLLIAVFCIAASFSTHNPWLLLPLLATVKLFATQGVYVIFVLTSEVFPTPVRTSGLGVTIVFGLLGMAVAPYILNSNMGEMFKYWVILALTGLSLLACLPLPETLGLPLPQTFQDTENLSRGRPITTWIHHWNQKNFPPPRCSTKPTSLLLEEDKLT